MKPHRNHPGEVGGVSYPYGVYDGMGTSTEMGSQSRLDLSQVSGCVGGVRDANNCGIHTQPTQQYCRVRGNMAYSGGVQGGQTAERVDAKTAMEGTTDEL